MNPPGSARGRSPSVGSAAAAPSPRHNAGPSWSTYKVGDLVQYHSASHGDWLPATIIKVDPQGKVIIDLKPNTWMPKEEQASKLRPRQSAQPASRCASPMGSRRPSSEERNFPQRGMTPSRAQSPSRAASPRRAMSRDAPPNRAASPSHYAPREAAANGTPRVRPPGIPRAAASPLRAGGRSIAGV
mmetsp:Transcript_39962/g.109999  ORF Transcript_39962/g.109999 Transcript_39962/m.109999 type:complete len:186 (+) Transcript_39962:3-560(+)